ncbi:hypothetical protein [Collinsella aerofaciens]|uniref:hypothetical protein n=1 Tax=Collinsella aerofaciens TaxID=74426 RepID=UPI003D79B2E8
MKVYVVTLGFTPIGVFKDRETALAVSKSANGSLFGDENDCHVREFPIMSEPVVCEVISDAERE